MEQGEGSSIQSAASEVYLAHDRSTTVQKNLIIETSFDADGDEDPA